MLLAPGDFGIEPMVGEVELQAQPDPADEVATRLVNLLEPPRDRSEGVGLQLLERQPLHLVHDLVHPDPLGERGVDIHRLLGDAAALVLARHVVERAHVVEPVGELDEQHANVVAQREQELAQVLRGALILRLRLDLAELGHPVDQPRDIGAEQFLDLLGGGDGVLDRVVEDRGDDRLVVELEVGKDARDFDRVAEIRVARRADLRAMRLHREDVGAVDQRFVRIGIVGADLLDEFILPEHGATVAHRPSFASAKKAGSPRGGFRPVAGRGASPRAGAPRGRISCGRGRATRRRGRACCTPRGRSRAGRARRR